MFISDSISSKYDRSEDSNEWLGCQNDIHCIQDFVADYIYYRIRVHGNRKLPKFIHPCKQNLESYLVRSVALIFEEKHEEELGKMMETLCESDSFSLSRYVEIMEHFVCVENETPSQMSYGRLIALIALAGLIATRLSDMKCFGEVSLVMSHTSKFLQKRIALTWPHHKRSWSKFFDLARTIIKLNKKEKTESEVEKNKFWSTINRLTVFGVLSITVFTLFKFMLRTR
ncbi:unnamed protein product [Litomosoides sigmodontis]|uniref:Bcl-2 Bcl-2 homology region 1-3 domain-containing protein n=1 Tax=Litomosoides sigmodontis TaxID=42156 RepID=A0A3P6V8H7_LITSI|nr:unnamed protein product [Litomosoides sigmodontis]